MQKWEYLWVLRVETDKEDRPFPDTWRVETTDTPWADSPKCKKRTETNWRNKPTAVRSFMLASDFLGVAGDEGWELVSVTERHRAQNAFSGSVTHYNLVFKRPKATP